MSSVALAALITMIGAMTGGISSFAAVWLVVIPLEAALPPRAASSPWHASSRSAPPALLYCRRHGPILPAGCAFHRAGAAWPRLVPRSMRRASRSAAPRSRAQARGFSSWRKTATGCSRAISTTSSRAIAATARSVSPRRPRKRCSACRRKRSLGHGLFDRVHVADRPAYLTALSMRPRRARAARSSFASVVRRRPGPMIPLSSSGSTCAAVRSIGPTATMPRASAKSSR